MSEKNPNINIKFDDSFNIDINEEELINLSYHYYF